MSVPRQTAIVLTTIFEPAFLAGFLDAIRQSGREQSTTIDIIIDRKTPESVSRAAADARKAGFRVNCPSLTEQEQFLQKIGAPADFIPYNSDNRRNVGFLAALERGCDVLISIDDDNYCLPGTDFLGEHDAVGRPARDPVVSTSDGWFNLCNLLDGWNGGEIFARGFPYYAQKTTRTVKMAEPTASLTVAMNAGLWLDEPDVDAVYRLCRRPKVQEYSGPDVVLGPATWSPINTQNTALTREAALTYYYIRMGFPLKGLTIDRFGDILSGYLTQKVIKHLGQGIRVGSPILDHRRTPHNLFKDLYHELAGIVLIEEFLPWLMDVNLAGKDSITAYESLADNIASSASRYKGFIWDDGGRDFLTQTASCMQTWLSVVKRFA